MEAFDLYALNNSNPNIYKMNECDLNKEPVISTSTVSVIFSWKCVELLSNNPLGERKTDRLEKKSSPSVQH